MVLYSNSAVKYVYIFRLQSLIAELPINASVLIKIVCKDSHTESEL